MKIVVLPKDPNPYQDLLYGPMEERTDIKYLTPRTRSVLGYITLLPVTVARLASLRTRHYRILHVHWVYPFYFPARLPGSKLLSYIQVTLFLKAIRLLRFKVVWTVHNVVPQNQVTINDARLMRRLARTAHAKIVHSPSVTREMEALHMPTDNVVVIPIGTYDGIYPDNISAKEARGKLHIAPDEFVVLFFGIIGAYKGVEDLIAAFKKTKLPRARLLIVGKCSDASLKSKLEEAATHPRIDVYDGFVPDESVALYFKACDVVALPFRKITTSSSIMLALAFGKPVIAPRLGVLCDLPKDVGYLYDATNYQALENTLLQAATHPSGLLRLGRAAKSYSDSLSWDKIAEQTYALYFELLES